MKLDRRFVEKPWGRTRLPPMIDTPAGKRIGEVWFTGGGDLPLLAKYIFTGERLSIQVHPNDEQARARGLERGKTECWYVLDAEPDASIGLGLTGDVSPEELRSAALDGSIERMIDWRQVRAGDFYLVPPGTIHAIGGGLSLFEFQQNSDVTYRLYDYGRPRELHVDEAVAVARPAPYPDDFARHPGADEDCILVDGPHFKLVHTHEDVLQDRQRWVLPLEGRDFGECLLLEPGETLEADGARMLIGAMA